MADDKLKLGDPLLFYNGEVTIRFCSEKNGRPAHLYYRETPEGLVLIDGVTTVCNIVDHSVYLMPWAVKMMYLKILKTMPRDAFGNAASTPWADFVKLLESAKTAHKDYFEEAGDIGNMAHKWIEDSIRWAIAHNQGVVSEMNIMAPTDERAVNCGLHAHKWMLAHNVRFLRTESKVYSKRYNYAGTMDGLAIVDSCTNKVCCPRIYIDELSLIDWKSSNHLKIEYLYQTAAYLGARHEEFPDQEIKSRWILRLGKEEGDFESWYEQEWGLDYETFLACLLLDRLNSSVEERMRAAKKLRTFHKREEKKQEKAKMKFEKRKLSKCGKCGKSRRSLDLHGICTDCACEAVGG